MTSVVSKAGKDLDAKIVEQLQWSKKFHWHDINDFVYKY